MNSNTKLASSSLLGLMIISYMIYKKRGFFKDRIYTNHKIPFIYCYNLQDNLLQEYVHKIKHDNTINLSIFYEKPGYLKFNIINLIIIGSNSNLQNENEMKIKMISNLLDDSTLQLNKYRLLNTGKTLPIHLACLNKNYDLINLLINKYQSSLFSEYKNEGKTIVELLLTPPSTFFISNLLSSRTKIQNSTEIINIIKLFIRKLNFDLNLIPKLLYNTKTKENPIHILCKNSNYYDFECLSAIIDYLLVNNHDNVMLNINEKDKYGNPALFFSINDSQLFFKLVNLNADIRVLNNKKQTLLHYIMLNYSSFYNKENILKIIKFVIHQDPIQVLRKDYKGNLPLHYIVKKQTIFDNYYIIKCLLGNSEYSKRQILTQNKQGNTSLHLSVQLNGSAINKLLLNRLGNRKNHALFRILNNKNESVQKLASKSSRPILMDNFHNHTRNDSENSNENNNISDDAYYYAEPVAEEELDDIATIPVAEVISRL